MSPPCRSARRELTAVVIVAMLMSTILGVDQRQQFDSRTFTLAVESGYDGTTHNHNQVVV
jgi:hypothetical protein